MSRDRDLMLVGTKLREADYFVTRMGEASMDLWAFSCDLSAFLSSARSVTFTMQSVMSGHPRWNAWYAEALRETFGPRAELMTTLRNISEKNGGPRLTSGSMVRGVLRLNLDVSLTEGLPDHERTCGVLELCQRHMSVLVRLVAAWAEDFADAWTFEEESDELNFGWQRCFPGSGGEVVLMASPGDRAPTFNDLQAAWPYVPDGS